MASKRGTKNTAPPATQSPQQARPTSPPPNPPAPALTLKEIQEMMEKILKDNTVQIKTELGELFEQKNMELRRDILLALQGLAGHVERIDQLVIELEENIEGLDFRMEKVEDTVDLIQKEVILSQYREMEYAVRVRGLKENSQEKLEDIAADLAQVLVCQREEVMGDVEKIFRVNSWVARQKNLPRDVVIYFSRKSTRNKIIQAFYNQKFQILGQDVIVLKEIPPKILKRRKDFGFLAEELKKQQIHFRWEIPVGIMVNYMGTRYRLDTVAKARDFYISTLKAGPSPPADVRKEDKSVGEAMLNIKDPQEQGQPREMKEDPKVQRMTRAAHRRKERETQQLEMVSTTQQISSEPVGGARPKRSVTTDLQGAFQRLAATKDGKVPDMEC